MEKGEGGFNFVAMRMLSPSFDPLETELLFTLQGIVDTFILSSCHVEIFL
jgi:hypothetical protein